MKNKNTILGLFCLILLTSCEKVIDVDLKNESPRLVVDAALTYIKGTDGKNQSLVLSTTTGFFDREIPKVSGATVYVTNSANRRFNFVEESNIKGKYTCTDFVALIGDTYTLTIVYKGETYKAVEKLNAVNKIDNIEQRADLGLNKDEYGIRVNFQDPATEDNFYIISYVTPFEAFPYIDAFDDKFFQGKIGFGLFGSDKMKMGDSIEIKVRGGSERYFNYMRKLISTAASGGGPFQPSRSSTIRGNVVNQTKESNYCLGFFSISETDRLIYVIK